jgi:hypothetical protein
MILKVPAEGYSRIVPAEGYSRIVPAEGYSRIVPAESYSRIVPAEGFSRDASCALNLISTFLLLPLSFWAVLQCIFKKIL